MVGLEETASWENVKGQAVSGRRGFWASKHGAAVRLAGVAPGATWGKAKRWKTW